MSKKANYMDAINHWMLFRELDRLETRYRRLLKVRNSWRKRARVAEAQLEAIAEKAGV